MPTREYLFPQVEVTLILLRGSAFGPNVVAQLKLHGAFDINDTHIAMTGMRIVFFL